MRQRCNLITLLMSVSNANAAFDEIIHCLHDARLNFLFVQTWIGSSTLACFPLPLRGRIASSWFSLLLTRAIFRRIIIDILQQHPSVSA